MNNFIAGLLDVIVAALGFLGITAIEQHWLIAAALTGTLFVSTVVLAIIRADRAEAMLADSQARRPR